MTQDTNGKVTTSQLDITNESQEVSPFLGKSLLVDNSRLEPFTFTAEKNIIPFKLWPPARNPRERVLQYIKKERKKERKTIFIGNPSLRLS